MKIFNSLILFAAEGLGLGRIPMAPGTFGSLWGLPLGWALGYFDISLGGRLAIWAVMCVIGVPLCNRAAELRNKKDPGSIVWDEMTAFPLVYAFVPITWTVLLAGFVLFRIFDVLKPWPIRKFERLPGGVGIMIDDQIAAIMAAFCLWLLPMAGIDLMSGFQQYSPFLQRPFSELPVFAIFSQDVWTHGGITSE